MKKIFLRILVIVAILFSALYISPYAYMIPAAKIIYGTGHETAFLDDYHYFDNREVLASDTPQPWSLHKNYNKLEMTDSLVKMNEQFKTVAYLIIKNDSILFEKYYNGYSDKSKSNSFSMIKSMVTAMLGKAIQQGKITSINQKVGDFYKEYNSGFAADLTVGDLSSMSSGMDWNEEYYLPVNETTESYFTYDLKKLILSRKIIDEPGKKFVYQSSNTELLAMVIAKATGQNVSDYFSEYFWKPIGAEETALWQLDSKHNGMEKAFCCFASNARDFARMGKLYLNHGKWGNQQLIDSSFVAMTTRPKFEESPQYGYGWWLNSYKGKKIFLMRGHLGQYVIVSPEDDLIIVRLGELNGPFKENDDDAALNFYTRSAYQMLENENSN